MDVLVHLRKKRGAGGRREATEGEPALATSLWGMLYADDAGVVSQSPEQPKKMMGVIVIVYVTFGLTVSEAKVKIMCLRTKGMPESIAMFSVEVAGQVCNQTNEFVYLGGNVTHNADMSIEVNRRIHNAWMQLLEVHPLSSKSGCQEPRYTRQCCTTATRGAHERAITTLYAESATVS